MRLANLSGRKMKAGAFSKAAQELLSKEAKDWFELVGDDQPMELNPKPGDPSRITLREADALTRLRSPNIERTQLPGLSEFRETLGPLDPRAVAATSKVLERQDGYTGPPRGNSFESALNQAFSSYEESPYRERVFLHKYPMNEDLSVFDTPGKHLPRFIQSAGLQPGEKGFPLGQFDTVPEAYLNRVQNLLGIRLPAGVNTEEAIRAYQIGAAPQLRSLVRGAYMPVTIADVYNNFGQSTRDMRPSHPLRQAIDNRYTSMSPRDRNYAVLRSRLNPQILLGRGGLPLPEAQEREFLAHTRPPRYNTSALELPFLLRGGMESQQRVNPDFETEPGAQPRSSTIREMENAQGPGLLRRLSRLFAQPFARAIGPVVDAIPSLNPAPLAAAPKLLEGPISGQLSSVAGEATPLEQIFESPGTKPPRASSGGGGLPLAMTLFNLPGAINSARRGEGPGGFFSRLLGVPDLPMLNWGPSDVDAVYKYPKAYKGNDEKGRPVFDM